MLYRYGGLVLAYSGLLRLIAGARLRDTAQATAKSVAGIRTPKSLKRTTRIACFFVRPSCTRVMTGWAGQPYGWPVS
ncbi:ash family protein [Aeromonas caviae]